MIRREFILSGLKLFKDRGLDEAEDTVQLYRLALRGLESEKLSANIDFAIILIAESVNGLDRGVNPIDDLRSTNKMLRDALAKYRAEIGEI